MEFPIRNFRLIPVRPSNAKIIKIIDSNEYDKLVFVFDDNTILLEEKLSCLKYLLTTNRKDIIEKIKTFLIKILRTNSLSDNQKVILIEEFSTIQNPMMTTETKEEINDIVFCLYWLLFNHNTSTSIKIKCIKYIVRHIPSSYLIFFEDRLNLFLEITNLSVNELTEITTILINTAIPVFLQIGFRLLDQLEQEPNLATRTVYEDKENVHDTSIRTSIYKIIEKLYETKEDDIESGLSFNQLCDNSINTAKTELKNNNLYNDKVSESLERISTEQTTFTSYNLKLKNVFYLIWTKIISSNEKEELLKRLYDELVEMNSLCSSGHLGRLVNVLSGFNENMITISWSTQILANIKAKISKKIQSEDEITKDNLLSSMIEDQYDYWQYLEGIKNTIFTELRDEFLHVFDKKMDNMDILTSAKFTEIFNTNYNRVSNL